MAQADGSITLQGSARAAQRDGNLVLDLARTLFKVVLTGVLILLVPTLVLSLIAAAVYLPYRADTVAPPVIPAVSQGFYAKTYDASTETTAPSAEEVNYVDRAREAIEEHHIVPRVTAFAAQYGLGQGRVLDVGSGTGYLQDVVENYVGLDISPSAARFYHKPFVVASATEMPFRNDEFDAAWSIWVLEHVPKPEQALREIRRVVKDGGYLFLLPAWNVMPYAAQGYPVRPYGDFGMGGKLVKATVPWVEFPITHYLGMMPWRAGRAASMKLGSGPTRLHYRPLNADYDHYWMPDSDAVNSLDFYEMLAWFTSRGDECLNCDAHPMLTNSELVIRVHKTK